MIRKECFLIIGINIVLLANIVYLYGKDNGEDRKDDAVINLKIEEKIKKEVKHWEEIDNLSFTQLKKRYKELINISKPYVIRKYLERLMIP